MFLHISRIIPLCTSQGAYVILPWLHMAFCSWKVFGFIEQERLSEEEAPSMQL